MLTLAPLPGQTCAAKTEIGLEHEMGPLLAGRLLAGQA